MNATMQRTQNLASCYENALTIILRLASLNQQSAANSQDFRTSIRAALKAAMEQAKGLGYSSEINQLAFFAVVSLLDESVLKLQSPAFADWARRPLQEELFGGHLAGETFFRNLKALLGQQDSPEVADALELHCLCLQMGYRGRYALGDSGELHQMLRMASEKIQRIRGTGYLVPPMAPPEVRPARATDSWSRALLITTCVLAGLTVIAFGGFELALGSGVSEVQNTSLNAR